jgi:hypothetical protein
MKAQRQRFRFYRCRLQDLLSAPERSLHDEFFRIIYDTEIGPVAGAYRAPVGKPEPFRSGECCHPYRKLGIESAFDGFRMQ